MNTALTLRAASRGLVIALLALAPVSLGRMVEGEVAAWLLVVSLAAGLWVASGNSLLRRGPRLPHLLLLLGLLATVAVTPFSVYLYDSLLALSLLLAAYLTYALCATALAEPAWNRAGWWSLAAGGLAAGLWGAREYMTTALLEGNLSWRAFGPFYNPNCLGGEMALLLAVPVALALGAQTRSPQAAPAPSPRRKAPTPEPAEAPPRYSEIAATACAAVLALALLCTGSKGAFLAALASALLFAFSGAQPGSGLSRLLRLGVVAVILAGLVGAVAFPPIRARLVNALGDQKGSGSFRVLTWQGAADMVRARPLTGFGPGTFSRSFPRFARAGYTRQAHQTPLQFAAESGIPAAVLLLGGMALLTLSLLRLPAGTSSQTRLLCAAAAGGSAGFWLHNCVDYTWYVAALCAGHWALLGLAQGALHPPSADAPRGRPLWSALLVPAILWSVVLLVSQASLTEARAALRANAAARVQAALSHVVPLNAYRWVELSRLYEYGASLGRGNATASAISARERAAALQPTEVTHWIALARLTAPDDPARAEAYLHRGLEVYPTSTEVLAALIGVQQTRGDSAGVLETSRRLAALYDTPVRTVQAVEYFTDENYLAAWLPLAREAQRRHDQAALTRNASRALRTAAAWVRSQRDLRQMLEIAGQYDPGRIEQVAEQGRQAAALLATALSPLTRLRLALAREDLDSPAAGASALQALVASLQTDADPPSRQVRAWALGGLAALRGRQKDAAGAREAFDQARQALGQVNPAAPGNSPAMVPGVEPEELAAYQALLASPPVVVDQQPAPS